DHAIRQIPFKKVADLGCGNAGRLVDWLEKEPALRGVGIDINPQAIAVAKQNRAEHHLEKRLDLILENVFTSLNSSNPLLRDVDLVTSFMMLHDLFNIKELAGVLFDKLRAAFPRARYCAFADTCLDQQKRTAETMPIFTMAYELVHAFR